MEEKIARLKAQMKELQAIEVQLETSPDKQVSLTDLKRSHLETAQGDGQTERWGLTIPQAPLIILTLVIRPFQIIS